MNRLMMNYDLLWENAEPHMNRNVLWALSTCEKLPIQLYRTITLVKLPGLHPLCSHSAPEWKTISLLSSQATLFQKTTSQGKLCWSNWAQLCCALDWAATRGLCSSSSAASVHSTTARCCSPPVNFHTVDSAFSLPMLAGLLSLESP